MRILLIVPSGYQSIRESIPPMPSLGVSYLASVLLQQGHDVSIIDNFYENLRRSPLLKRISSLSPEIIGLSFGTDNRFAAIRLIHEIKRHLPGVPVVIGGPHPSLATEDFLSHVSGVDCAAIGEAEETFSDILKHYTDNIPFAEIPGIAWMNRDRVVINRPRPPCRNLDSIPFPARHLFKD